MKRAKTMPSTRSAKRQAVEPTRRRPRADAVRNRRRLIEAAIAAFAQRGLDVGVAEIARRAGVGAATLFRHFPTKDDLVLAVFEARMEEAVGVARRALGMDDPGAAFEWFLLKMAEMQLSDTGFFDAIRQQMIERPALRKWKDEIEELLAQILARAQRADSVRPDVTVDDLRFVMMSLAQTDPVATGGVPNIHRRFLRILLDGMKPAGASVLEGRAS